MNDTIKTLLFVVVAIAVAGLAWFSSRPLATLSDTESQIGQPLFPDFKDPTQVASIEIVKYNPETSDATAFQVKQVNNRWSIPSHENYPTDAQDQLIEAAGTVLGLDALNLVSSDSGDQEYYGVIEPDKKDLASGSKGVGTKVVLRNQRGDVLIGLIIGNEVKGQKDQRYVRRVGQNSIFVTKVKTDKLSTQFGDWIEKDLLKIDPFDIKKLTVNDYSIDILKQTCKIRGIMTIDHADGQTPAWTLSQDLISQPNGQMKDTPLAENEELNVEKLATLSSALDDLKIVDVRRKPAGLSSTLKTTGDWEKSPETQQELMDKGFYMIKVNNQVELLSNEGEISVEMGQGVTYILRFGALAVDARNQNETGTANRYLFVMATLNDKAIPKPQLEELPAAPNPDSPDAAKAQEINEKIAAVKAENDKKVESYNAQLKAARERVDQLNKRFADWYYVINDGEYKKIHLTHQDLIQQKKRETLPGSDANAIPGLIPAIPNMPRAVRDSLPGAQLVVPHDDKCSDPNCKDPAHDHSRDAAEPGTPSVTEVPTTNEEAKPTESEAKPTEGEAKPTEGETKPAEGEAKPAEGEAKPAEGEAKPAEKPVQGIDEIVTEPIQKAEQ